MIATWRVRERSRALSFLPFRRIAWNPRGVAAYCSAMPPGPNARLRRACSTLCEHGTPGWESERETCIQQTSREDSHEQEGWRGLTPLFYQQENPYGRFTLDMTEIFLCHKPPLLKEPASPKTVPLLS